MPTVNLRENDSFDVALRRFKRACEKAGILSKLRQIEFHEKPTTKRKRKKAAACKRELKRLKKEEEVLDRNRGRRFNFDTATSSNATILLAQDNSNERVNEVVASAKPKADVSEAAEEASQD